MPSSVRTKQTKKQPAFAATAQGSPQANGVLSLGQQNQLESAVMELEEACLNILLEPATRGRDETQAREQARQLKNIATPISLALRECEGMRRFHHHYRHDPENPDTLTPVLEPSPYKMVAALCAQALEKLSEFHVVEDSSMRKDIAQLRHALGDYMNGYLETVG